MERSTGVSSQPVPGAWRGSWLPIAIGVASLLVVVGWGVLDPSNVGWLAQGDPATHFLGWSFFRDSPWSFPLGLNPSYGLELGNAIVYSDSIPLLAILFKAASGLLPHPFQYTGLWWVACFTLQSWFAWKLVGVVTRDAFLRAGSAVVFTFAPPMLWRLQEHPSLVGHFLVVAALYLLYRPERVARTGPWALLIAVAALVHAYLLFMVAALWLADLLTTLRTKGGPRNAVAEATVIVVVVALASWQAGYFSVRDSYAGSGYGLYQMNLLAIFESQRSSLLFPDLTAGVRSSEGYNYLGLGAIFLVAASLPALVRRRADVAARLRERWMLAVVLVFLTLMALSNHLTIGASEFDFEIPDGIGLKRFLFTFRAAGRMFWPVFYVILFCTIALVVRGYSKRHARMILGLAALLQVADTSGYWSEQHARIVATSGHDIATPLKDAFWALAATRYQNVRHCPPGNKADGWDVFSTYATRHHLGTDMAYLARMSASQVDAAIMACRSAISQHAYRADTLYILSDDRVPMALATLDAQSDLLSRIDGYYVLAPGWKTTPGLHDHGTVVR